MAVTPNFFIANIMINVWFFTLFGILFSIFSFARALAAVADSLYAVIHFELYLWFLFWLFVDIDFEIFLFITTFAVERVHLIRNSTIDRYKACACCRIDPLFDEYFPIVRRPCWLNMSLYAYTHNICLLLPFVVVYILIFRYFVLSSHVHTQV